MEDTKVGRSDAKDDPAKVARQAVEALLAGKDSIVAGSLLNKAQVAASKVLPQPAQAATHAQMTKPDDAP